MSRCTDCVLLSRCVRDVRENERHGDGAEAGDLS
jgi:hypothetical protein